MDKKEIEQYSPEYNEAYKAFRKKISENIKASGLRAVELQFEFVKQKKQPVAPLTFADTIAAYERALYEYKSSMMNTVNNTDRYR